MNELVNKEFSEVQLFSEQGNYLAEMLPGHEKMLKHIEENLPEIGRASSLFRKTQSQFMDNVLTVSHLTPIRNLRQILAEIERSMQALREAYYGRRRTEVEIKKLEKKFKNENDELEKELIAIDIADKKSSLVMTSGYISGAIRKVTNHIVQYNSILESFGVKDFDEIDFEKEEEKYHIMKVFEQAICAARSRGGTIDEGNQIYFHQIGINGAVAQSEIFKYLQVEKSYFDKKLEPPYALIVNFLNDMADKFKGCSSIIQKFKGMKDEITDIATIKQFDYGDK
jgi:hypothetical protein